MINIMKNTGKTVYMDRKTFNMYSKLNESRNKTIMNEAYIGEEGEEEMYGQDPRAEYDEDGGYGQMDPETQDYAMQIRQLCLNGIQKYGQEVDSEEYDFYKKIWLMCDKLMSTKESGNKE